jgi:hypothetical protein
MSQVRVQFFTILDGEMTRERFNAEGGSTWMTGPPLTVNSSRPSEGIAQLVNLSTVDVAYWRSNGDVTFFVTITEKNNQVTALATANKGGYSATANVSGNFPEFTVGVNFRSP